MVLYVEGGRRRVRWRGRGKKVGCGIVCRGMEGGLLWCCT